MSPSKSLVLPVVTRTEDPETTVPCFGNFMFLDKQLIYALDCSSLHIRLVGQAYGKFLEGMLNTV